MNSFNRSKAAAYPSSTPLHRTLGAAALAFTLLGVLAGCASTQPPAGVQAVTPFELARYQGRWYEIARMDHRFERGMSDVSATYTPQPDGSVRVLNRGYDGEQGRWREAIGRAVFTGATSTGSLKVSFFGPFYGGYHIAAMDKDYRWSLVIGPDRSYCWILARERQLTPQQRSSILASARDLGIDTAALIWVSQQRQDPAH